VSAHATRYSMRWAPLLLIIVFFLSILPPPVASGQEVSELQINSAAYIVIDADTGEIFAQKNAHEQRAIASLTKVFTLIEALKRAPLNMTVTTETDDLYDENSSLMGFGPGETFTLEELMYGLMLPSGNDAAHAIARAIGTQPGDTGDDGYERFVGWLNERVQRMGLEDTALVNPHGWGVPGHHSTAYDLAAFIRYALQEPEFVTIFGTETYITANGYELRNNNRLMYSYDELIGGKTGYDWDAGYCLIAVAQRNGHTAISVTLDGIAPDDWYDDNRVLLDYALTELDNRGGEVEGEIAAYTDPDISLLSVARSTSALSGRPVQIIAAGDDASADSAGVQGDPDSATEASSNQENAGETGVTAPGFSASLAIALAVAAAFVVLAGRGFSLANAAFGPSLRSFFSIKLPPPTNRLKIRGASRKSPEEVAH
jgi:serine-type D-Ala-D-Ala carboxypeptidase (penicillin-binding protein 5/6)